MCQGQEEMAWMVREIQLDSALSTMKGKKPAYTFRKKSNEIQSLFINQVVEQVTSAASRIERVKVTEEHGLELLKKAKEDLDKGMRILSRKQKMIKFADRSEAGCAMVEYEDDAWASNPEDEKKMEKVVREADKMAKKRKLRDSKEAARKEASWHELPPTFAPTKPAVAPKITRCLKALASVLYPLISVSEHLGGEIMCCEGAKIGNVTPNGVETVGFKLKEKLLENFDENEFDEIQYKQWTTTDRSQLETISQSTEEFVETFITKLQVLSRHDFIAQEQSNYLKDRKAALNEGEVLVLGDFSENYTFIIQDAIQGYHWTNTQATLHQYVYYLNLEDAKGYVAVVYDSAWWVGYVLKTDPGIQEFGSRSRSLRQLWRQDNWQMITLRPRSRLPRRTDQSSPALSEKPTQEQPVKDREDGDKKSSKEKRLFRPRYRVTCYNCGKQGHITTRCPGKAMYIGISLSHKASLQKSGLVEGKMVESIVLDPGCSKTLVHHALVPHKKMLQGEAVTIQCAHGDNALYPLAKVNLVAEFHYRWRQQFPKHFLSLFCWALMCLK
ncbi:hypothetical protein EMCRGX_G026329 [Ephydatia muelleri]